MEITKEKSYMLALPKKEKQIRDVDAIIKRLKNSNSFSVTNLKFEKGVIKTDINYKDNTYNVEIYPKTFDAQFFYQNNSIATDIDIKKFQRAKVGICVSMLYSDEYLDSYHLQLKVIYSIISDTIAIIDINSQKVISGGWAKLAAMSKVPPAPSYIYTVQAINEGDDDVWLHTHGLNRCGITDLEILKSSLEYYNEHYHIIDTLAKKLIESSDPIEEKEPIFLARLSPDVALVVTLISWKEAINYYDKVDLGGYADRQESHNENTYVIFAYPSEEDYENGVYKPVTYFDELTKDNPIYMLSTNETMRMKALALERFDYVRKAFKKKGNTIIVKIGLKIDEEYSSDTMSNEHIWFELKEINNNTITAELTQEPYYISNLHKGSIGTYDIEEITDWVIYTPKDRITPDLVYKLK